MGKIKLTQDGKLIVPDEVEIPYIEGDGIGADIMKPTLKVLNKAVEKAYNNKRKIIWKEVLAGEKAFKNTGNYLPEETIISLKEHVVALKGPLTTPFKCNFKAGA